MTQTKTQPSTQTREDVEQPRSWNVVLLNDEEHGFEYVIRMLQELFGHDVEKASKITQTVDRDGRAVCLTTHKEHAELKRDQVLAFGRDATIAECRGSMSAIIEPADFGGEDDDDGVEDDHKHGPNQ